MSFWKSLFWFDGPLKTTHFYNGHQKYLEVITLAKIKDLDIFDKETIAL